ncbi:hypothetical protein Ngar_c10940 [Candidatus Nitrososphaera gargensis Ga9.2]|uniref:Uncharacterized protein n=1 Tax=Nitrososphaera gargensis (strain Ga9.2) TaxID=1237085 RepID=K0I9P0_NITGG|nr:hypothetical protein Ngar_c10940 [Candidatus Nitrososphaera gargensis Ga9.2]
MLNSTPAATTFRQIPNLPLSSCKKLGISEDQCYDAVTILKEEEDNKPKKWYRRIQQPTNL